MDTTTPALHLARNEDSDGLRQIAIQTLADLASVKGRPLTDGEQLQKALAKRIVFPASSVAGATLVIANGGVLQVYRYEATSYGQRVTCETCQAEGQNPFATISDANKPPMFFHGVPQHLDTWGREPILVSCRDCVLDEAARSLAHGEMLADDDGGYEHRFYFPVTAATYGL